MASSHNSLDNLKNTYKNVVEDVMRNVRESFLDEGVDMQVLEELKQLWSSKIDRSRVVDRPPKILQADPIPPSSSASRSSAQQQGSKIPQPPPLIHQPSPESIPVIQHAPAKTTPPPPPSQPSPASQTAPIVLTNAVSTATVPSGAQVPVNLMNTTVGQIATFQHGMVPVQTPQGLRFVPLQAFMSFQQASAKQQQQQQGGGSTGGGNPSPSPQKGDSSDDVQQIDGASQDAASLPSQGTTSAPEFTHETPQGNPQSVFSGCCPLVPNFTGGEAVSSRVVSSTPSAKQTDDSIISQASSLDCAGREAPDLVSRSLVRGEGVTGDGVRGVRAIVQLDGGQAGSSEEDDSDIDDTSDEEDQAQPDDDDPLNSEDDDADNTDKDEAFETEDTIVCQWEKVLRVKNKWKLQLKDGVMHLGGHDYVFQKTIGEAEW